MTKAEDLAEALRGYGHIGYPGAERLVPGQEYEVCDVKTAGLYRTTVKFAANGGVTWKPVGGVEWTCAETTASQLAALVNLSLIPDDNRGYRYRPSTAGGTP